jgi:hypothetical protein
VPKKVFGVGRMRAYDMGCGPEGRLGMPAHLDQRHSGLESRGSSNESHSGQPVSAPSHSYKPTEASSGSPPHAPASVLVADAHRPTVRSPPFEPLGAARLATNPRGMMVEARSEPAQLIDSAEAAQHRVTEGREQLRPAMPSTAQQRNGYQLSPISVRRQQNLADLEGNATAGAAEPEMARSAIRDSGTRAYFANTPYWLLEQQDGGVLRMLPHASHALPVMPLQTGECQLGAPAPHIYPEQGQGDGILGPDGEYYARDRSHGRILDQDKPGSASLGEDGQGRRNGLIQKAAHEMGGGAGVLSCRNGTVPEGTASKYDSGGDVWGIASMHALTHSTGQADHRGPPGRCSPSGGGTPDAAMPKRQGVNVSLGNGNMPSVVMPSLPGQRGDRAAADHGQAPGSAWLDARGSSNFGGARGPNAFVGRPGVVAAGDGRGMRWNGETNEFVGTATGEGAFTGVGKRVAGEGVAGKAWTGGTLGGTGERQLEGGRKSFITERVKQDIVTRGHCGSRDGTPNPASCNTAAAAKVRAVAPMSLYPVDITKGHIAPGESGK